MKDLEKNVINDFGKEWMLFNHKSPNEIIQKNNFYQYFYNFPFKLLNKNSVGFDAGCGTGRWANYILEKGFKLNCIEPSAAITVAKKNLRKFKKAKFINKTIIDCKLENNSQDFGYCLGVLHHTNDVKKNLIKCNNILKKNAPFLLYLYYNFENRGKLFKFIWKVSDILRILISKLPFGLKKFFCFVIAIIIYLPLAKLSFLLEKINISNDNLPLNYYKDKNFYIIYNDALDRFGTKLEKRFSKKEIKDLLINTGFKKIKFNKTMPFWTVISYKK